MFLLIFLSSYLIGRRVLFGDGGSRFGDLFVGGRGYLCVFLVCRGERSCLSCFILFDVFRF